MRSRTHAARRPCHRGAPQSGAGGGFVLIYSDITERKRAEEAIRTARDAAEAALRDLQTAQASLVQAQKMAALGQLTAGIAHEIKNPLNFVNNFSAVSVELIDELKAGAYRSAPRQQDCEQRSARLRIRCRAISTRSCSTASVPMPSSRTCCCTRARARVSTDLLI